MKVPNATFFRVVICIALSLVMGGCASLVDPQANQTLLQSLGNTSFTVFPTFVRYAKETSYDNTDTAAVSIFLTDNNLGQVTVSDQQVAITGGWQMNQSAMWRESAEAFAQHLAANPIQTDYALLPEYLIGGNGVPVGIHCYILNTQGDVAAGFRLNSHYSIFTDANLQTAQDCTAVLIQALADALTPNP